jgi:excisionase family DNA binding protein
MIVPANHSPDSPNSRFESIGTRLLTLREAAAFLNVHPNTVRSQVRRGKLPGVQVGRGWRFLEADLIGWIRSRYRNLPATGEWDQPWLFDAVQQLELPSARQSTERALDALLERSPGPRARISQSPRVPRRSASDPTLPTMYR